MKGAGPTITLPKIDIDTCLVDVKNSYATQTGKDASKVKLLYNKRPASDLKSLRELLPKPAPENVELTLMILGGGTSSNAAGSIDRVGSPAIQVPDPKAVPMSSTGQSVTEDAPLSEQAAMQDVTYTGRAGGESGTATEELKTDRFWSDLQDFLVQRLRDEAEGRRLAKLFRDSV